MPRRLRWVLLGIGAVLGLYALAGLLLSSRYDAKVAAFRASDAYTDLEQRRQDVPADENAVPLFANAAALLERIREQRGAYLGEYLYPEAWDPDERAKIFAPLDAEDAEETVDSYDLRRDEMRSALPMLEPFIAAVAAALERPAVQYPLDWYRPGDEAFTLLTNLLPFRARLLPDRAAESGDLLLRLGTKWLVREMSDTVYRHQVLCEALRIVRDVLERDPAQAAPYVGTWRNRLGAEDPLAQFRFQCAEMLRSTAGAVEDVRGGSDPYGSSRSLLEALRLPVQPRWFFRWYARPLFYWSVITEVDTLTGAIENARTEAGLRDALQQRALDRITRTVGVRMLEQIALQRLSGSALAAAAGEPIPELLDPFTGRPLAVRRGEGATVIAATLPEEFREAAAAPDLLSWDVPR